MDRDPVDRHMGVDQVGEELQVAVADHLGEVKKGHHVGGLPELAARPLDLRADDVPDALADRRPCNDDRCSQVLEQMHFCLPQRETSVEVIRRDERPQRVGMVPRRLPGEHLVEHPVLEVLQQLLGGRLRHHQVPPLVPEDLAGLQGLQEAEEVGLGEGPEQGRHRHRGQEPRAGRRNIRAPRHRQLVGRVGLVAPTAPIAEAREALAA